MTNTIDITDLTDNVLTAVLTSRSEECVTVGHLTVTERYQLAEALGMDAPHEWLHGGAPASDDAGDRFDYEGAILARQESMLD